MPNPKVRTLTIGGVTYDLQDNISGYITGITSSDVTTALGFTPYNATNPNGYTSNTGTITKVKTTAGTHTAIDVSSGAVSFNVPTNTSHLTNDSGYTTEEQLELRCNVVQVFVFINESEDAQNVVFYKDIWGETPHTYQSIYYDENLLSGEHFQLAYIGYADGDGGADYHWYTITFSNWYWSFTQLDGLGTFSGYKYGWDGNATFSYTALGNTISYNNLSDKPTNVSSFINDAGYLTSYTETDPTVPSWAKQSSKPSYALSELTGAADVQAIEGLTGTSGLLKKTAANTWTLDTSTYLTSYTETDPVFSASAAAGITSTDITNWNAKTSNTGTVTSVRVQATSPVQSSVSTEQTTSLNTTISLADGYGDTKNPYGTKIANYVLAGPASGNAAAPTFRELVAADIPNISWNKITSDKPTTISGYGITDAYTKTEIDNKVSAVLRYKGVKATVDALPSTGNTTGDVWHVTATSGEYAWDGTEWQELGTAISIPAATGSNTTGISVADHSTTTIYGVGSSTTSVTGVSGSTSVYGVKSGTNSTTTASHVKSGGNGTAPTLGTAISIYGVKSGTNSTTTASHVKSGGNGTAPTLGTAISIYGVKSGTNSTTTASHVKSGGNGTAPTLGTAITVRGVKTGTNSTTTASKASGANGTAPTLGTPISVPNVTSAGSASTWSFSDITVPIRADADTTVPTAAGSATTVPIKNTSATTVPTAATSATTVPIKDTSATACDDITAWSAGSGSLTFTMDSTDTKKLVISHTHTAPSLSYTARSIIGVQSSTTSVTGVSGSTSIYGVQSTTTSVTGVSGSTTVRGVKTGTSSTTTASKASGANGTAPTLGDPISVPNVTSAGSASTWSFTDVTVPIRADADTSIPNVTSAGTAANWVFEDVTVPIRADNATSIPNVTSVGSASNWVFEDVTVPIRADNATSIPNVTSVGSAATWTFEDVTVPIRADSATTVPTAASSATTVPIKDGTATTVVTSKTHSITDNGHTHTI